MKNMKTALMLLGCVGVLATAMPAAANPVMLCSGEGESVIDQEVTAEWVVGLEGSGGPYEVYRWPAGSGIGPGDPGAVLVEDVSTESTSADMGSGVESATLVTATESCVPLGDWEYAVYAGSQSYALCSSSSVSVTREDPSCAFVEDDDDEEVVSGCAMHGRGAAAGGGLLLCLLALGLARRRRS